MGFFQGGGFEFLELRGGDTEVKKFQGGERGVMVGGGAGLIIKRGVVCGNFH